MIQQDTIPDGYIRLFNGKLRAKAGRGKTPYGLTQTMLARIGRSRAVSERPKNRLGFDLSRLFKSSLSLISDACEMAREGQKDRARNWWRFFTNANLVQMFDNPLTQKITGITPAQVKRLSSELYRLKTGCHPDDIQDWNSDIAAIRHSLEEILQQMPRKKVRAKKKFELADTVKSGGVLRIHPFCNSTPDSPAPRPRSRANTSHDKGIPAINFPWPVRQGLYNHKHK